MGRLFSIYRKEFVITPPFDDKNALDSNFEGVKLQNRFAVAQGIADLETAILDEFSKITNKPLGKLCSISIWLSLWLLILIYREHMDYLQNQNFEEPAGRAPSPLPFDLALSQEIVIDPKFNLANKLYNILVIIHYAVFRTKSPMIFVKGSDQPCNAIWEDISLLTSFQTAREELRSFCTLP